MARLALTVSPSAVTACCCGMGSSSSWHPLKSGPSEPNAPRCPPTPSSPCRSFTVYARHPVWSRVVGASGQAALELDAARSASMQFATSASKAEAAMGLEDPGDGNGKAGAAPIQAFT